MEHIKNKIKKLRKNILKYDYFYHTLNTSLISDAEYDYLFNQLYNLEIQNKELITSDSPTQKIGSGVIKNLKKVIHFSPMLSLNNVFDLHGYINFENRIKKKVNSKESLLFCCELKLDGVAISIIYEDGLFVRAATRGDGYIGENITLNAKMIQSIPLKLKGDNIPQRIEVRGEICMLKSDFIKLNKKCILNKKNFFSNPRNAAAGSLRHLNPEIAGERNLVFFCHGYTEFKGIEIYSSHYQFLKQLQTWGLPVREERMLCSNHMEVYKFYKSIEKKRSVLDLEIDGIVIKLDFILFQKKIGYNSKAPRWAVALKFSDKEKITTLVSIKFQVGRTGVITPVAYLEPVEISGVVVQKASLYNKDEINKLNLHFGDQVLVRRSGDVIPKIINVIRNKSLNHLKKIQFPEYCPVCLEKLISNKKEKIMYCPADMYCKAQKKQRSYHFFSKNALYARGLGLKIIDVLIESNYIHDIRDFFYLTTFQLQKIKYINKKNSIKIISSIKNCKNTTFARFIFALGIFHVGKNISEKIANHFQTLDALMRANITDLKSISDIGDAIAKNIFYYFAIPKNKIMILEFTQIIGISWNKPNLSIEYSEKSFFFHKTIVLTGTFNSFSRIKLIDLLENLGAKVLSSISKKIDYLIVGNSPGSKLEKAKILKLKIIYQNELHHFLKSII